MSNSSYFCLALGTVTRNRKGDTLEAYFPAPMFQPEAGNVDALLQTLKLDDGNHTVALTVDQRTSMSDQLPEHAPLLNAAGDNAVAVVLQTDAAPASVEEAYLKLQLLSHRLVKPHGVDLSGIFGLLPNNAWTNEGAIDLDELEERRLEARSEGRVLQVESVDKFPKMTDYVVPAGVRVADTRRVRLGAYLGEGTTIMHEGFVNFNAGTEGPGMIEGRISAGVFVGRGSDLGGGCSTMGTLSGGNSVVISVGEECLIGANAGIGIPLGDRCTVEAGLYLTAGSVVTLLDDNGQEVSNTKARDLAGKPDLLFRRNSLTGRIECKTNKSAIELNEELHAHN
jgi:2,3,4,5-tetrahydropyridine-2-carboxylate N-succinyltransferase